MRQLAIGDEGVPELAGLELQLRRDEIDRGGLVDHDECIIAEVIDQRRGMRRQVRSEEIDRRGRLPQLHVLERAFPLGPNFRAERLQIQGRERLSRKTKPRQGQFGGRQQPHLRDSLPRALRVGLKGADRLDFVAEEIDPDRVAGARREEVEDAAASRDLARLVDQGRERESMVDRPLQELILGNAIADANEPRRRAQVLRGHHQLQQAVRRGDDDRRCARSVVTGEDVEHRRALGGGLQIKGELLVWEGLRRRPGEDPVRRQILGERAGERFSAVAPRSDDQDGTAGSGGGHGRECGPG